MLTLIGESMARVGMKFVFEGASEECATCKLRFTCTSNLDKGHVYEIVEVRKNKHFCPKENGYLVLVDVIEPALEMAVDTRRAIVGMTISYVAPCDKKLCPHYDRCVPLGIEEGERVTINKIVETIKCPNGSKKIVEISRV